MPFIRRYSIPKKRCKHVGCTNYPKIGCGGFCWKHEKEDPKYQEKQDNKKLKKAEAKIRQTIVTEENKLVNNAAAATLQQIENFFFHAAVELDKNPRCEECGKPISKPKYYRSSTAHVLPKRKEYGFPSVAADPLNRLFLGAGMNKTCNCHDIYDSSWEAASKMKIWRKAVAIVIELYPKIHPSEHKNIPDILWKEIEKVYGKRQ